MKRFLAAAAVAVVGAAIVWSVFLSPYRPGPDVPVGYDRCGGLCITRTDTELVVSPADGANSGLIFYPESRVPPTAYLEIAAGVAGDGHVVVVPDHPLDLAWLGEGAALEIMDTRPEIEHWVVGGHGRGGVAAAEVAQAADGLVLVGSALEGDLDLIMEGLATVVVYGTADEVVSPAQVRAMVDRLAGDAELVAIEGGNHAGFGDYGDHRGDGAADVVPSEQTARTAEAIVGLFDRLGG